MQGEQINSWWKKEGIGCLHKCCQCVFQSESKCCVQSKDQCLVQNSAALKNWDGSRLQAFCSLPLQPFVLYCDWPEVMGPFFKENWPLLKAYLMDILHAIMRVTKHVLDYHPYKGTSEGDLAVMIKDLSIWWTYDHAGPHLNVRGLAKYLLSQAACFQEVVD